MVVALAQVLLARLLVTQPVTQVLEFILLLIRLPGSVPNPLLKFTPDPDK